MPESLPSARALPAGVDLAQYKSEVLHRTYRGRMRPISHYSLGRLPRWISVLDRLGRIGPALANRALADKRLGRLLLRGAGIDPRRAAPAFATQTFHRWWFHNRRADGENDANARTPVVLWTDSFTDGMNPEVAQAAVTVLTRAGYRVIVPDVVACCGLTWITTGQLTGAKKRLQRLLDVLGPYAARNIPIVGLEPSCTAVLRSDLVELLPDDPRSAQVAGATRTLSELLTFHLPDGHHWQPPDLSGLELIVQPHCHQHAVMGFGADAKLLSDCGADLRVLSGCCGLAGNFGMEKGHYEMSVAIAENALLPALRARTDRSIVLADGFSCRTQVQQLTGLPSTTLVQLLADRGR